MKNTGYLYTRDAGSMWMDTHWNVYLSEILVVHNCIGGFQRMK